MAAGRGREEHTGFTRGLLPTKIGREGRIHHLRDGHPLQVSLPADGLYPALLDVKGGALGLPSARGRGAEGLLPALPPGQELRERGDLRLGEYPGGDIGLTLGTGASPGEAQGFDPVIEGAFGDASPNGDLALGETFLLVKGLQLGVSQGRAVHRGLHGDGADSVYAWVNSGRSIQQVYTGGQG